VTSDRRGVGQRGKREGLELLRTALDELRGASFVPYFPVMLGALAQGLTEAGHVAQALATIDEALAKCEMNEERWSGRCSNPHASPNPAH